jgi:isoleucyl-tRNA synthetase
MESAELQELIEKDLENGMEIARDIVEKSGKLRDENQYNLRWPAKRLVISTDEEAEQKLNRFRELIKNMANVKSLEFGDVASEPVASPDYSKLGPKFGGDAEKVADLIENLEPDQVRELENSGEIELENYQVEAEDVDITSKTMGEVSAKSFESGELFLDLEMDEEIEEDAYISEVIRAIQQKRKEVDLEVEDKVNLSFQGDTSAIEESLGRIRERVKVGEISFDGEGYRYSGTVEFQDRKLEFSFSAPIG